MRIKGWRIDGFGVLNDYSVSDLPPGITVVQGPNGSGKSTLLGFLRTMLFGTEGQERHKDLYPHLGEGLYGGLLDIEDETGCYSLDRQIAPPEMALTAPDGTVADGSVLDRILGSVDRQVFERVFGFSVEELASLKTLGTEGVGQKIYEASLGVSGERSRMLLEQLAREIHYFEEAEQQPEVLDKWRALEKRLAAEEERAETYPALVETREELERSLAEQSAAWEAAAEDERKAERRTALWPRFEPLEALHRELADLDVVDDFVDEPEERLARALTGVDVARAKADDQRGRKAQLEEQVQDAISHIDDKLLGVKERSLEEADFSGYKDLCHVIETGRALRSRRREDLGRFIQGIDAGWDEARVLAFEDPGIPRGEVFSWQVRFEKVEGVLEQARQQVRVCEQARRKAGAVLEALRKEVVEALTSKDARLRKAVKGVREQAERVSGLEADLQGNTLPEEGCPSLFTLGALGTVAVCMIQAAVWRFMAHDMITGITLAGAGTLAITSLGWLYGKRMQYRRVYQGYRSLREQLQQSRSDFSSALEAMPNPDEDLGVAFHQVEEGVRAAVFDEEHAQKELENAEKTSALFMESWRKWAESIGFTFPFLPVDLFEKLERIETAKKAIHLLDEEERLYERMDEQLERWENRLKIPMEQGGRHVEESLRGQDLLMAFEAFLADRAKDQESRSRVVELQVALGEAEEDLERDEQVLVTAEEARDALFAEAGVADEEAFRNKLTVYHLRQELKTRLQEMKESLADVLEEGEDLDRVREDLLSGSPAAWQEQAEKARERCAELTASMERMKTDLGELEQEIRALERSTEMADLRLAIEEKRTEVRGSRDEQDTVLLEQYLLEGALEAYLNSRQPTVLKETSRFFSQVTDGAYTEVALREDGKSLVITDGSGRLLNPEDLSLRTTELLYLCMRFGLIKSFAGEGLRMPVILDDVLVNFDPLHTRGVIEVLDSLARNQQVLVLTCHPQVVEQIEQVCPGIRVEHLPARGSAPKKTAKTPKPVVSN